MPTNLIGAYEPAGGRYDEMLDGQRAPRGHWREFLGRLAALPNVTLVERRRFVRETIASDGVTYNVYADPRGMSRPWELDLLPLILPAAEWREIASAVAQRARLLNAILDDLYGAQTLLAEGLIPPALVFGQRSFLLPALGVKVPGGVRMHLYAADLARSPDGRFWVLSDRTRGPSGAGYALQNRMTLSRAYPNALRDLQVEQVSPFFSALSDALTRSAPCDGDAPLVVLLTPGPYNETYFEHSFLARCLGFPLVEGQDLLVRGDAVYLKTLRGLRRVHVILRRLDDDFCDPLELRADSTLGIPGLLHAVRANTVMVANALGSGLLETGAFSGFYPAIEERLFGDKLAMPSIATWWCGEPPALEYVCSHLDELVIKPAYPSMQMEPVFGHTLDPAGRADLVKKLRAQPLAYVAQEWVRLSHSPSWSADAERLLPRATTMRVFAVATSGVLEGRTPLERDSIDGTAGRSGPEYLVMSGALTRVAPHDGDVVSMQWGGSSKDTWILAENPIARTQVWRPRLGPADITQSVVDIVSRVGEGLFWMGRYAERCEGLARLFRAALGRLADPGTSASSGLGSLSALTGRLFVFADDDDERDLVRAVTDPAIPGGVAANVLRLIDCSHSIRERMSRDNWNVLNRLQHKLPEVGASLGAALEALDEITVSCVALAGFAMDDMTRDESWHFLSLGRRTERLSRVATVVAYVLGLDTSERTEALEWLLETANSIVTYRARYRRRPELLAVVHLLVIDDTNPNAVAFQLRELTEILARARGELGVDIELASAIPPLAEALRGAPLAGLESDEGDDFTAARARFEGLLGRASALAANLSDALQRRFFSHAGSPAPVGVDA